MSKLREYLPFLDTFSVLLVIPLTIFISFHQETNIYIREVQSETAHLVRSFHQDTKSITDILLDKWPELSNASGLETLPLSKAEEMIKTKRELRTEEHKKLNGAIRDLMNYYEVQVFYLVNRDLVDRSVIKAQFGSEIERYLVFFENWRSVTKEAVNATYPEIEKGRKW